MRAARRQPLVVAEQCEAHDLAERHPGPHEHGLERGRHPVAHVRIEERRVIGGDDRLDLTQQVEGAATGHPVHGGHDGLPAVRGLRADRQAGVVHHPRPARLGDDIAPVDPRAERPVAAAGQHDGSHVLVEAEASPQRVQLAGHRGVEAVEPGGSIERDRRDAVGHLVAERLPVGHGVRLPSRPPVARRRREEEEVR